MDSSRLRRETALRLLPLKGEIRGNDEIEAEWMKVGKIIDPISDSGRPPLHASLHGPTIDRSMLGKRHRQLGVDFDIRLYETSRNVISKKTVGIETLSTS
jgi:hypothetical protein